MQKPTFFTLVLIALFGTNNLQAQINIGGNPVSYNYEERAILDPLTFVQTPPLDMTVVEAEDVQWEAERAAGMTKTGRRFGIEFEVNYDLHNSGTWTCLPDGGKLWRLGVECPKALSINLIFDQYYLPAGATVYIYSEDKRDKIGGFTNYNNQADNFFATDVVLSDKIVIEYFQPVDAAFDGELRLATIVHGYRGPGEFMRGLGQAGACQRNTICPENAGWEDQIRSVFALYNGGWELCSGAIVNNTADDGTPYALTANHCWEAAKNTGSWVFRFNWESPTCTPTTNSAYNAMSGATFKMRTPTNYSGTDCCLVELNQPIPAEWMVYYAGWSRSTEPSSFGMCIHHPSLDIKKITQSSKPLYTATYAVQVWWADWFVGGACTEPGSSGSPLFDSNHRIVGQEYGGGSYCGAPSSQMFDVYGRFDLSWNGSDPSNRLKDWLDPLELDSETLDGRYSQTMVDAELLNIIEPDESYYSIKTIEPKIKVKNSGSVVITSAVISYTIDEGAPVSKTWTGNFAAGAVMEVVFDPITLTFGNHVFKATITVDEDANPENSEKIKEFEVLDCFLDDVLLQEDFEENGLLPACWKNIALTGASTWEFVTGENNGQENPDHAQSGSYNARFKSDKFGNKARLISPPMNLINSSIPQPTLVFWHAHAKYDNKQDGFRVYYKNALNAPWIQITSFTNDVTSWKKEAILLPEPSDFYWIAFEGMSGGGSGTLLDNISVISASDVSIGETHGSTSLRVYPNPTTGELRVEICDMRYEICDIQIFDVMGRVVSSFEFRVSSSVFGAASPTSLTSPTFLNIAQLPNGIYFIRIQTENTVVVRKIVKQ